MLNEDNSVRIYLPRGQWTDFYDDTVGGRRKWMEQVVPLDKIPVYAKENAIIPMGPEMEYIWDRRKMTSGKSTVIQWRAKGRLCS